MTQRITITVENNIYLLQASITLSPWKSGTSWAIMATLSPILGSGALSLPNLGLNNHAIIVYLEIIEDRRLQTPQRYILFRFFLSASYRLGHKSVCIYLFELAFFLPVFYLNFKTYRRIIGYIPNCLSACWFAVIKVI